MAAQFVVVLLLLSSAVGTDVHDKSGASLRNKALGDGSRKAAKSAILKQPEVMQDLVICNAYASPASLDIYHVQTLERLTGSEPLKYKDCREFTMPLSEGDQLDFKAGSSDVGTFYATGLPTSSSSLLLIPHRRDSKSKALTFESHAFADLQSPQIAVVDAYKGTGDDAASVKITDVLPGGSATEASEEMLAFSSVVAVNPGNYKITLASGASGSNSSLPSDMIVPLLVNSQKKYVVMRVGIDGSAGSTGKPYPQELVVFPNSGSLGLSLGLAALVFCAVAGITRL